MQEHEDAEGNETGQGAVSEQFGQLMRSSREDRGLSQRQLAEILRMVDLHLDPSAITRIERGSREVKLFEALAIAKVLGFDLDYIAYSPDELFQISASNLAVAATRARKVLLQAIRYVDHMGNHTDEATEQRLMAKLTCDNVVELYTLWLGRSPSFQFGGNLGTFEGDNFAVYFSEIDRSIKQAVVEAVVNHILISEDELEQISERRKPRSEPNGAPS